MKSVIVVAILLLLLLAGPVSSQQQFIDYSQVTRLRWVGPGRPDTYAEYLATHPPGPLRIVPLRMAPMQIPLDGATPCVLVIVNSSLQPLIQTNLDRYISDIQAAGYAADLYSSTLGSVEDLKDFIISQSTDLVGCVLVGDLPCAWYEIEKEYDEYAYVCFPCDLYLMDLDGAWDDLETMDPMQSGVYDTHKDGSGDTAPEIFIGRIDASSMTGDAEHVQTNNYLDKLHSWYSGQMTVTDYALTYTEDEWANNPVYTMDIEEAFPNNEAIKAPDTDRYDYSDNRLTSRLYQFIQLTCHSNPSAHYFTRGGGLYSSEIRAIPPRALFYNLICCSALRFTFSDFLGGAYIFNPSTTSLATIGSTKSGAMLYFRHFYEPLGEGKTLGQAFSDWFNAIAPYSRENISWHYGMTIIGDPMIVPVSSHFFDLVPPVVTVTSPSSGETCMAGDTLLIEWIATDENGADSVAVSYSLNAGRDFTLISSGEPNDLSFVWIVPVETPGSDSCVARVEAWDPSLNTGIGYSNGYFAIQDYVTYAGDMPLATALMQNYPNPFNGHTTASYSLEKPEHVSIRIYDTVGRLVRVLEDRDREAGRYEVVWNGRDDASRPVASGIYFMKMDAGSYSSSRKIVYLR